MQILNLGCCGDASKKTKIAAKRFDRIWKVKIMTKIIARKGYEGIKCQDSEGKVYIFSEKKPIEAPEYLLKKEMCRKAGWDIVEKPTG